MAIFDKIELSWGGRDYVIPPHRVLGAICRIEDVVTLEELHRYGVRKTAPLGKLASAYASVLRYAGARVEDDDVYAGMFTGAGQDRTLAAVTGLLGMMVPPDRGEQKETPAGNVSPAAVQSSKNSTRRRSGKGGSRGRNSGAQAQPSFGG